MLFSFLYEIALWVLAFLALPKLIYQSFKFGKYRDSIWLRLGYDFPKIDKGERKLIWIHAVSVGETKAVSQLAKQLKQQGDRPIIVISSTTETGHAEAKRSLPFADYHVYLPMDFKRIVKPIIEQARPDLVILAETDFWYNFMRFSKKAGASIVLVNGKVSTRSLTRFLKFNFFAKTLFSLVDLFCVQNPLYRSRFEEIGVCLKKIIVTGNMKFDEEYSKLPDEDIAHWRKLLGISEDDKVLVAGSTHDPEEVILLDSLKMVWEKYPHLKVMIVPRHPERFNEVSSLLTKKNVSFVRFSNIHNKTGRENVILVDAMGVLRRCYQLADIALVGGSYVSRIGGHNIIEPCWYGKPVIFGPHMHSQLELVDLVKEYHAGEQVNPEKLGFTLMEWLVNPPKRISLGQGGFKLVNDLKGATEKNLNAIAHL